MTMPRSVLLWVKPSTGGWVPLSGDNSGHLQADVLSVANPGNLDLAITTLRDALRGTSSKTLTDLATALAILRWGVPREPAWVNGDVEDDPGELATLVSQAVTAGKTGRLFGLSIVADEANTFALGDVDGEVLHYSLGSAGVILIVSPTPIWDNIASETLISVKNIAAGGGAGKLYQARLLYDEA